MLRLATILFAAATITACASATDRLCEENLRCQGDEDPAGTCAAERAECDANADCTAKYADCEAQNEALSACVLAGEATCQDVGETSFYLPTDTTTCEDELKAFTDCVASDA
jgi:hypothetical protein